LKKYFKNSDWKKSNVILKSRKLMKSVKSDNSSGWRTKRWQYWRGESVKLEESKLKCHSSRDQTLFKIEIKPFSSQKS
jgi:hypothetical protein